MTDLIGTALLDYYSGNYTDDIITSTSISDEDILPLPYLFRDFEAMPLIEKKALGYCKGRVLDVGSGAGNHSLWLQQNGLEVKAIDSSKGAIAVCIKRGVKSAVVQHLLEEKEQFDTILLLMNGTGIFNTLNATSKYLQHLKSLLLAHGQILIDSTDIIYMYDEGDSTDSYYGELDYFTSYKTISESGTWLYLDTDTFEFLAEQNGFKFEIITEGDHYDYLARLSVK